MKQKDKNLLLIDICARVPWGVKVHKENSELDGTLIDTELRNDLIVLTTPEISVCTIAIENCKPYLRPMSSMTEDEDKEWQLYKNKIACACDENLNEIISELHDWFNSHYFDYRGLIEKGLAIEAPDDMYK